MNYYRRFVGSYLKKTTKITMIEDGAYTRLLDTYYADEKPLIPAEVYVIARAMNAAERRAVDSVVEKYFTLGADGLLHNEKADEELDVAVPKIAKQKETGKINGAKGGRPKKTKVGSKKETNAGSEKEPSLVPENNQTSNQPSTVSHQPSSKPPSEKRFPGGDTTPDSAASFAAAAVQHFPPLTLDQAKLDPETPAAILASVCVANGISATAFHPLVVDWARDGVTVDGLKSAIATARMRKPAPQKIPVAYLDTILADAGSAPKADARWRTDDHECERVARALGLWPARAKESWQELRGRIAEALHNEARSEVR